MANNIKVETISWDVEVDLEAARLIRQGVPPWVAVGQAVQNVSKRRKEARD